MLPLTVHVKEYFQDRNYFEAVLASGELVAFDPFVSCAITLTDEEYEAGKGQKLEGKNFLVTEFTVYKHFEYDNRYHYMVAPHEGGIIEVYNHHKGIGHGSNNASDKWSRIIGIPARSPCGACKRLHARQRDVGDTRLFVPCVP